MNIFETYPGGKGNCYQQIINQIPPHDIYIEAFLGGGAILRKKRPARHSIGIDADREVIDAWMANTARSDDDAGDTVRSGDVVEFIHANAIDWLQSYEWTGTEFIYLDPPYLDVPNYYNVPFTYHQHMDLLLLVNQIPAPIAISGYTNVWYKRLLKGWRLITFEAMTRSGETATEHLWMNYPEPSQLHDYRYLGDDYRERERIRRKAARWVEGLKRLPQLERQAIMARMEEEGVILPGNTVRSDDGRRHAPPKMTRTADTANFDDAAAPPDLTRTPTAAPPS
jgi:hypothetical protein